MTRLLLLVGLVGGLAVPATAAANTRGLYVRDAGGTVTGASGGPWLVSCGADSRSTADIGTFPIVCEVDRNTPTGRAASSG